MHGRSGPVGVKSYLPKRRIWQGKPGKKEQESKSYEHSQEIRLLE
jgi:hypothetical protein